MTEIRKDQIRILFVDDDEMMRIFFRDIFWIHGRGEYQIEIASSHAEASQILEDPARKPHIIFLDMMVPDGKKMSPASELLDESVAFIKKLKADPRFSKTTLVVFSGHKDPAFQKKVLGLGVNGYLVKGEFMPKEIIDFVDKLPI